MSRERPWLGLAAERGTSEAGWTEWDIRTTSVRASGLTVVSVNGNRTRPDRVGRIGKNG